MEAIKLTGIAKDGKITIAVPDSLNEQELEVIVLFSNKPIIEDKNNHDGKIKRLMSIVGTAKYPNLSTDALDVYEQ